MVGTLRAVYDIPLVHRLFSIDFPLYVLVDIPFTISGVHHGNCCECEGYSFDFLLHIMFISIIC